MVTVIADNQHLSNYCLLRHMALQQIIVGMPQNDNIGKTLPDKKRRNEAKA